MNSFNRVIKELKKIEPSRYTFFEPIKEIELLNFEKKIDYKLPSDYKNFLQFSNGAIILSEIIYGVNTNVKQFDAISTYFFETEVAGNPMPKYLLPISPNGRGDHYCLDLSSMNKIDEICNVVFWQHDYFYNNNEQPDIDTPSFLDFLMKIINEYLKDNYSEPKKL